MKPFYGDSETISEKSETISEKCNFLKNFGKYRQNFLKIISTKILNKFRRRYVAILKKIWKHFLEICLTYISQYIL